MLPANLALVVYVTTHNVETVKKFDFILYVQFLSGLKITRQTVVREVPGSIPRSGNDFKGSLFCWCCGFTFGQIFICYDILQVILKY